MFSIVKLSTCAARRDIVLMLHQLAIIIVNGMTKYYEKEYIGAVLLEAIKFCVPRSCASVILPLMV